jgi:hypothetical protein
MNQILRSLVIMMVVFVLAGCATPINWQARVGIYTYDQAVMNYGPPDSSTKLSDGTTVAQWMTQRGQEIVSQGPYFYGPGYVGPVWSGYTTSYFPARFLRLSFSPGGKLTAYKEFSK